MTWVVFLILIFAVLLYSLRGQKQVAWSDRLRWVGSDVRRQMEITAPDYVMQQVRNDYLMTMRWLRESAFHDWSDQWYAAPAYLEGYHLQRHLKILNHHRQSGFPQYRDVLHADHAVEVRHFADDGERCLVIDHQTHRIIATFDYWTFEPCVTQSLDDAALVYQMVYDRNSRRWKLEQFIQELPCGWRDGYSRRVKLYSSLPPTDGRDH